MYKTSVFRRQCSYTLPTIFIETAILFQSNINTLLLAWILRSSCKYYLELRQSRWLRRLRHRSAAVRLLRLRVRNPLRPRMSLMNVLCHQVETSATGLFLVQRSPVKRSVSVCDPETSTMGLPSPSKAVAPQENKNYSCTIPCENPRTLWIIKWRSDKFE
jgi:hypothetical protein